MTRKMTKNTSTPRRDTKGKFISNRIKLGSFYRLNKGSKPLVVRARRYTQNHMILVDYNKVLFALVKPGDLQTISKEAVAAHMNS